MKKIGFIAGISFFLGAVFFALIFGTGQGFNTVNAEQIESDTVPIKMGNFSFAPLVKRVRPAVVKVLSKTVSGGNSRFNDSLLDRFFSRRNRKREVTGVGSGFLISSDGYIITNNHVVENAIKVMVKTLDGKEYSAEIIGKDPKTDLALLKIDGKNLPYIELGDSSKVEIGEWVLAIGNPLNQDLTVTSGIISAKGRQLEGVGDVYVDFLQTDASINRGNSGGPLINMKGKVIGINSVILSQSGGSIGIGFAIPSDMAKKVIGDLKTKGSVVRGWLGVGVQSLTKKEAKEYDLPSSGILIGSVESNSPAKKAGIKISDFIIKINGKNIKTGNELRKIIGNSTPGTIVKLTVLRLKARKNITKIINIKIGKAPDTLKFKPQDGNGKVSDLGMVIINNSIAVQKEYGLSTSKGILVKSVERNGFAAEFGIKSGDIIFGMNRSELASIKQFNEMLDEMKAGRVIRLWINRNGYESSIRVQLPN